MHWKRLALLSLFAAAMGLGTVFFIPSTIEPVLWFVVIFPICAYVIAKQVGERPFTHGFVLSLLNSVWVTGFHVLFAATYLAGHPDEARLSPIAGHPRLSMLVVGPIIGVVSGLVQGLFAWVASKFVKKA
jgi:hypothetical protein